MPTPAVPPSHCPHCGHPLPSAVTPQVLAAAKVLARQPDGEGTSEEVAASLHITRRAASELLRHAQDDGLVALVDTLPTASGHGRRLNLYVALPLVSSYP